MIICCTRFLSAKFGHSDYIILTFKAEFLCHNCSDFITSSYLNAPEALKLQQVSWCKTPTYLLTGF